MFRSSLKRKITFYLLPWFLLTIAIFFLFYYLDFGFSEREGVLSSILTITGLTILLGIFVSLFLAERLARPIRILVKGVKEIERGDLNYRFKINTNDEIQQLAEAFNSMIENLQRTQNRIKESKEILEVRVKARTRELEELAQELEHKAGEKTAELQQRVDELENLHKLTVGRETKMMELKEKVKQLQAELAKLKSKNRTEKIKEKEISKTSGKKLQQRAAKAVKTNKKLETVKNKKKQATKKQKKK